MVGVWGVEMAFILFWVVVDIAWHTAAGERRGRGGRMRIDHTALAILNFCLGYVQQ